MGHHVPPEEPQSTLYLSLKLSETLQAGIPLELMFATLTVYKTKSSIIWRSGVSVLCPSKMSHTLLKWVERWWLQKEQHTIISILLTLFGNWKSFISRTVGWSLTKTLYWFTVIGISKEPKPWQHTNLASFYLLTQTVLILSFNYLM